MDIGAKIREARLSAHLTQEQAAEALGVSRQTMSNWENNKTYPDIVSVIKMSDLYDVSLDHLLKEKVEAPMSDYMDYLEESTNIVKSKARLSRVILIVAYLCIWAFALLTFWFFISASDAMGYSLVFLWMILPVSTIVISFLMGKNNDWGKGKWIAPAAFGFMQMLAEYATFGAANMAANSFVKINMPDFGMFFAGAIISAIGLGIGELIARAGIRHK